MEREKVPRTLVTEVADEEPGVRVFVVQSEERLAYERAMREAAMEKTRQALEKLSRRVAAGRLKKAQKIGEAAARVLGRNHGSRYYGWSFEKGVFRYFEHPGQFGALEKKLKAAKLPMSSAQAWEALRTMHVVDIRVGTEIRRGVTAGNHQSTPDPCRPGNQRSRTAPDSIIRENDCLVTN
jgi:hypothetical protein